MSAPAASGRLSGAIAAAELLEEVRRVAREVAAAHADEVDRRARFPVEAIDALRAEVARAGFELARCCAATGMVFAMHQIQVATIVRHLSLAPAWFRGYLRELATEQRLIASITSEIGTGGDMGSSIAALTPAAGGMLTLEKRAPTVSYGAYADDFLTTARRSPAAERGDQVLVLHRAAETTLEPLGEWDTLGMRGTCSPGFAVRARFRAEQVLAEAVPTILTESLVPLSHILWSWVWLGIATDAFERGRRFVRESARRNGGEPTHVASALSRVMAELSLMRGEVSCALEDYLRWSGEPERLSTLGAVLRFNNLKLAASEQVQRICGGVLQAIGIAAYRNDTPFSVARHVRDALSARVMVANDRIHATDAGLLLLAKEV